MGDNVIHLLERPTYGLAQIDHLLRLPAGTARRWIDGYRRAGKPYPPVIREQATGVEIATWGEFVETRLLAEYREAGVPLLHLRPVVEALRDELRTPYPLAEARTWLSVEGRELVRQVQDDVSLDRHLALVEVATGQSVLRWSREARNFLGSAEWAGEGDTAQIVRMRPVHEVQDVVIDPLQGFGEPVVRGVRTEVIGELMRAGESPEAIAALYELPPSIVNSAIRYELLRVAS
jgi:uncharacterized protein (DUF433 family)